MKYYFSGIHHVYHGLQLLRPRQRLFDTQARNKEGEVTNDQIQKRSEKIEPIDCGHICRAAKDVRRK